LSQITELPAAAQNAGTSPSLAFNSSLHFNTNAIASLFT